MVKYGVDTPAACYASSMGIHDRAAAIALAAHCPYPEPAFGAFPDWLSHLSTDELTAITAPDIAALLIRSAERRSPRAAHLEAGVPTYPGEVGESLPGVNISGYSTFRDTRFGGTFEGQTQVGLGVRARLPFRVLQLADRVVVDVAHSWTS
ncbi:hypothetical protein QQY66_03535 [Streptomyces sp. DG2A-72]|uniref:AMIN-like domain-containing (lipo)protein n=1 Tax=Streptomyces sp. DG2A-72 TaxID=3051386 RepID=UPI00265B8ABF|nr:hypothetical protein [Streptomyces sp. DG2A-72]MDO0930794.1 hypothetical protein [Streptomyces sp. DG2A-72]